MKNLEIAEIFNQIADILDIQGANPFRIRAYKKAAQNLEALTEDLETIAQRDEITDIPGIGEDLASKIKEYLAHGKIGFHHKLLKEIPAGLLDLMTVPNVGPKTAKLLFEKLGIDSIEKLEAMAKTHKICGLPGIKDKTEENILHGIDIVRRGKERMALGFALPIARQIVEALKARSEVKRIQTAGSLRRMKETVRDIDILITSTNPVRVMDYFVKLPQVTEVLEKGETRASVRIKEGIQVDVRVVEPASFGAALCYFTGSKAHNIHLREMAVKNGLKINEYGVFDKKERRIAGREEVDVYRTIDLPYIEPELREDTGEIEAALRGQLPDLIESKDICGDLHVHSNWSDGAHPLEELAEAASERGYGYIAITDHTKRLPVAGGLSDKDVLKQIDEIKKINKRLKRFRLLASAEVDILLDGSLDYKDETLRELDIVVAAIHSGFKQSRETNTKRLVRTMQNKYVNVISHPTGRLIGERDAYEVDLEEVFKVARDTNTALEINAYPNRLDLTDIASRRAHELGANLVVSTDAHTIDQLDNMHFGINVCRRAWLGKDDILNTLSWDQLSKRLKK